MKKTRRFSGVIRLYGQEKFEKFQQSHICVIGIGGVGSWAVESLARHGIGQITMIDFDHIAESNINRQIHALDTTMGASKIEAMKDRAILINGSLKINCIDEFLTIDNINRLIKNNFDYVLDAIDQVKVKIALIDFCHKNNIRIITTGGAGGRTDPTQIKLDNLKKTHGDKLISKVRRCINKNKIKTNIPTVFSSEPIKRPKILDNELISSNLNCEGYGSSLNVTSMFGFIAVNHILNKL